MLGKVRPANSVQEWWEERSTTMLRVGQEVQAGKQDGKESSSTDVARAMNELYEEL